MNFFIQALNIEPSILFISWIKGGWKKLLLKDFKKGVSSFETFWILNLPFYSFTGPYGLLKKLSFEGGQEGNGQVLKLFEYTLIHNITLNLNISASRQNIKNLVGNFGAIHVGKISALWQ